MQRPAPVVQVTGIPGPAQPGYSTAWLQRDIFLERQQSVLQIWTVWESGQMAEDRSLQKGTERF